MVFLCVFIWSLDDFAVFVFIVAVLFVAGSCFVSLVSVCSWVFGLYGVTAGSWLDLVCGFSWD